MLQDARQPPSSLVMQSVRAHVAPSVSMKENMVRSFAWIEPDQLKSSNKPEWPVLLHNLCYFHSCLRLRLRYTKCGWNEATTLNFNTEEFLVCIQT